MSEKQEYVRISSRLTTEEAHSAADCLTPDVRDVLGSLHTWPTMERAVTEILVRAFPEVFMPDGHCMPGNSFWVELKPHRGAGVVHDLDEEDGDYDEALPLMGFWLLDERILERMGEEGPVLFAAQDPFEAMIEFNDWVNPSPVIAASAPNACLLTIKEFVQRAKRARTMRQHILPFVQNGRATTAIIKPGVIQLFREHGDDRVLLEEHPEPRYLLSDSEARALGVSELFAA